MIPFSVKEDGIILLCFAGMRIFPDAIPLGVVCECGFPQKNAYFNCACAAVSVLRMRIARVMGPTPPGTGVIAEATFSTAS